MTGVHGDYLLSPYRVLDLTDERGLLCGKILADLGADVIQIEPPGGSTARDIGPYYQGEVHPEKSLFWWAYAINKRGITLNLETIDGRALLKQMVKDAHFLIESWPPGTGQSVWGLHRFYRASVRSGVNPGRPGLPAAHRAGHPFGYVAVGNVFALLIAFAAGLCD